MISKSISLSCVQSVSEINLFLSSLKSLNGSADFSSSTLALTSSSVGNVLVLVEYHSILS